MIESDEKTDPDQLCRCWTDVTWEGRRLTLTFNKQKREKSVDPNFLFIASEHKILIKVYLKDSSFNEFSLCKDVTLIKIEISS